MPRIKWIDERDAQGQLADLFAASRAGLISGIKREHVPDILHHVSHRPDFLAAIMDASRTSLFGWRTHSAPSTRRSPHMCRL